MPKNSVVVSRVDMLTLGDSSQFRDSSTVTVPTSRDFTLLSLPEILITCAELRTCTRGNSCPLFGHCQTRTEPLSGRIDPSNPKRQLLQLRLICLQ